jgi:hypothetical protein
MKKVLLFLPLLLVVFIASSQSTNAVRPSKDDYLQKSKKQKKVGRILLGGGAALIATGVIIPKGESQGYGPCLQLICEEFKNDEIKSVLFLTGGLSMLSSIPFFIVSGKNKRRAVSVSMKTERASYINSYTLVRNSFPAIALKIKF